ncbi:MAG: hypothetical protein OSJ67_04445 [Clostridia bacterium]|nr:hypothetical protein [Clostridia bacterium]
MISSAGISNVCAVAGSGATESVPCGVVNVTLLFNSAEMLFSEERNNPPHMSSAYNIVEPTGRSSIALDPLRV